MRFLADNTVGKLRRWMSLLGYDAVYDPRGARELLADIGVRREGRTVLGRCPSLAEDPAAARRFFHLESESLKEQLIQITRAFPLDFARSIFTRCSHCNVLLAGPVGLEEVKDRVPDLVRRWREEFRVCPRCDRVYWQGTHTARVRKRLCCEVGLKV